MGSENIRIFAYLAFVVFTSALLTGCVSPTIYVAYQPPANQEYPPFSHIWNTTLEKAGVDPDTVTIHYLTFRLDRNNTVDSLFIQFTGRHGNEYSWYQVSYAPHGSGIEIVPLGIDDKGGRNLTTNPGYLFLALEKIPYVSLNPDHYYTLSGMVDPSSGGVWRDVYEISNDPLIPVDIVAFDSTADPIYPIYISLHPPPYR